MKNCIYNIKKLFNKSISPLKYFIIYRKHVIQGTKNKLKKKQSINITVSKVFIVHP